ncbi:type ISP restriction/modification enzyme [Phascolarctobacterium succinatutens]|uniref:type ISP restriction/modification enzyme n=2 Tax=Phascolarctobacterium succinatutens TaxID=626940 RepID=UPI003AB2708C
MATFWSIIQDIRKKAYTEHDKGTHFERLICNYLKTSKKYEILLKEVWLWNEFPYRKEFGGSDTGIDLVALTKDGHYWAIQCKCYADDTVINKAAVDSFLSTSSRQFVDDNFEQQSFSSRLWFATNNKWGKNAKEAFENQNPPAYIINSWDVADDETVDWDELDAGLFGSTAVKKRKISPKKHQETALANAAKYYKTHDRGKLIMACGTGKTYTSLCLVEQETQNKGLILVLVPSIALINQTLNEWQSCAKHDIYPICVCSDSTASRLKDNDNADNPVDLAMPASTNYVSVAQQLVNAKKQMEGKEGLIVVYSTYQSIDVIGKAQRFLRGEKVEDDTQQMLFDDFIPEEHDFTFDYIVCDEAHRTTGVIIGGKDESAFTKVHNNSNVAGKHRLYMTATPRLYADNAKKRAEEKSVVLCSMDDKNIYGEEIYRIGFGEAVEKDLLSDYKVLILTVRENTQLPADLLQAVQDKNQEINADDAVKLVGVINALSKRVVPDPDIVKSVDPALMHRAVAFCSKISVSKVIANSFTNFGKSIQENFQEDAQEDTVIATAKHIDGSMNANERNELVSWLRNAPTDSNECRILTNVRCLSEGVDVPSLDAVIFLSKRNSQVDVVQSVGRVMRKAEGKKYGYIIIPVIIPDEGDPNTILDNNDNYAVIWTVLNALRAHDDRFNAFVNKLELNEKPPTGGGTAVVGGGDGTYPGGENTPGVPVNPTQLLLFDDEVRKAIYAKMVLKVGTKRYWEQWADDIAKIAQKHINRIQAAIKGNEDYKTGFEMYMEGLHKNINPNITEQAAIEMLAQHFIAKPVFDALFENYSFVESNPVSKSMKNLLDLMQDDAFDKEQQDVMERFYKSVKERCEGIDNAAGKQKVIVELYDKFFKKALAKTVEKLGIVYTPVEVVDFINQSVADVLKKEFNRSISDENIHIIDPFTGTGTFITRLLQSGLIKPQDIERKYKHELHANEIVLLAYYIASINIENAFHDVAKQENGTYTPFDGICLTDTFQMYEDKDNDVERLKFADVFPQNSQRVIAQSKVPMRVIIGNPPYSVGQKSANDDAQNESYPRLEKRIAETYAAEAKVNNKNALYDSYIKAFRYAGDILDDMGGVIGFVTNAGWLDGNAMDGLRKCFEKEFSSIYVYNLRGNARTSGELRRKEKDNVFGQGTRTPVAILILVKNPKAKQEKATIYYREVDDYLTREQKLDAIIKQKSVTAKGFVQKVLQPNEAGDWLNPRSDLFEKYIHMEPEVKFNKTEKTFFNVYSLGLNTSRDSWVYNFNKRICKNSITSMIDIYNKQLGNKEENLERNPQLISWSSSLTAKWKSSKKIPNTAVETNAMYRPFNKINLIWNPELIHRKGQFESFFPTKLHKNIIICTSRIGSSNIMTTLISDTNVDYHMAGDTQCFPLYWYEEKEEAVMADIFAMADEPKAKQYIRHDGVTDYILHEAREKYRTNAITKEDIFYYVYGFLHSEEYRKQFAADLKKMLPRLPLVENAVDFKAFSEAGRKLADLHLNYEKRPKPEQVIVERKADDYIVEKMKFKSKQDKSVIVYNNHITIKNIPLEAYDYVVNGRSAIEWIMERYQVKLDKASQIKNDPNDWAKEHNDPTYILDLLLSVITVSLETMKIVKGLPKVEFDK